ncbi:MAG: hypothetical protein QOI12_469 [Alphaproteobacteria bacterium]|nr:hypothetical protein [Alphaproteobacteria bacterium]
MPWKASSVMEERLRFVARLLDGEAMTDMCREFGISRKTGYKIFDRYREHGLEALSDRSRRPVRYANQLPQPIESLIVRLKGEKPHWGARKLRELLVRRLQVMSEFPPGAPSMRSSIATAWSNASADRATAPAERRCRRAPRPTSCGAPTSRASSSSATGATVIHSPSPIRPRASCCRARRSNRQGRNWPLPPSLFAERGLPLAIRSDNGVPFASPNALFGLSKLSVWWLRLGITIERIKPGHPQQNGRHERMHLTLKKEATRPPGSNSLQQQARFDAFVHELNAERPHEALAMKCPAELYSASPRRHDGLPELAYPFHDRDILVTACARICLHRKKINAGRPKARHQGSRRRHLVRQLQPLRSRKLRSGAENPAAPRQPVRPEVVTHVLGTFRYPCLRAGQLKRWRARKDSNLRPPDS